MDSVYTVVVNWNRAKDTLECLGSLDDQKIKGFDHTIIIVDNGSTDDSVKKIKDYINKKPNYTLLQSPNNQGFVGGNNVGINYALAQGADYLILLNNDTIVDKNLIVNFLKVSKSLNDTALLSPKIYFAKGFEFHKNRYKKSDLGRVIWSAGGNIDWNNVYATNRGVDEVDIGQYDEVVDIEFATGACVFCPAQITNKLGGFDGKYYMYFEDVDFSVRARKLNYKIIYVPDAIVWHKVAQSSGVGGSLNDYFTTRNRLLFGYCYASIRTRAALYKESLKMLIFGREWQKKGVIDFYFMRYGKGSWK